MDASSKLQGLSHSFNVSDEASDRFVKFVKYEMVSRVGEEALCVLTSFQVFGHGEHVISESGDSEPEEPEEPDVDPIKKIVHAIGSLLETKNNDDSKNKN